MSEDLVVNSFTHQSPKWYNNYTFSLIPVITTRKADEYNTSSFSFRWLIFKAWSLDTPSFEIAFTFCAHWGTGFTFLLPYLRLIVCIPCPESWAYKTFDFLRRKPKCEQRLNIE